MPEPGITVCTGAAVVCAAAERRASCLAAGDYPVRSLQRAFARGMEQVPQRGLLVIWDPDRVDIGGLDLGPAVGSTPVIAVPVVRIRLVGCNQPRRTWFSAGVCTAVAIGVWEKAGDLCAGERPRFVWERGGALCVGERQWLARKPTCIQPSRPSLCCPCRPHLPSALQPGQVAAAVCVGRGAGRRDHTNHCQPDRQPHRPRQ